MKAFLSCICICFSLAAFSQAKADTFHVVLKAVEDHDIKGYPDCGFIKVVATVPFSTQSAFGNVKEGEIINLIIICPEMHKGLGNIVKGKKYRFKIYYQYERNEYGDGPGYYLD